MFNTFGSTGANLVGEIGDEMQDAFHRLGSDEGQVSSNDLRLMSPRDLYLMACRNPRMFDMCPWLQRSYHELYERTHPNVSVGLQQTIH